MKGEKVLQLFGKAFGASKTLIHPDGVLLSLHRPPSRHSLLLLRPRDQRCADPNFDISAPSIPWCIQKSKQSPHGAFVV